MILKPAEETPASALAVLEALLDAGLPKGVAQIVFGVPDEVSKHLLASPVIRKLSFTGSTVIGRELMRRCADTVKKTTLELGGHAPVIVFDDCDFDRTVETLVTTKFRNAGQVCVSPTRFYVQQGIYERFVKAVHAKLPQTRILYIGVKPSLLRWMQIDRMRLANQVIRAICERDDRLAFLDFDGLMLGWDEKPLPELFVEDGLHMSPAGYQLWSTVLRPYLTAR